MFSRDPSQTKEPDLGIGLRGNFRSANVRGKPNMRMYSVVNQLGGHILGSDSEVGSSTWILQRDSEFTADLPL